MAFLDYLVSVREAINVCRAASVRKALFARRQFVGLIAVVLDRRKDSAAFGLADLVLAAVLMSLSLMS